MRSLGISLLDAPEPLRLIGNPEENFYILGKKHQQAFQKLAQRFITPPTWREQLEGLKSPWRRPVSPEIPANTWGDWLKSYCEGLEVPVARYLEFLQRLEASLPPTGTSVLCWNAGAQKAQHLRLIDTPAHLQAGENASELILIEVSGAPSLLLVCMPNLPFLPLAAMNSHGVTLAVHAKYHQVQHAEGRPISEIVIEGLLHAKNVNELKRHIKNSQTQRLWGLISTDPAGSVMGLDIAGPQLDALHTDLQESNLMVFNAAPLVKSKELEAVEPPNFAHFCRMQRQWAQDRLKNGEDDHPLITLTRAHKLTKDFAPAISSATRIGLMLTPATLGLDYLLGPAPIWQQGEMLRWQNLFTTQMRNPTTASFSYPKDERAQWKVRQLYTLAQDALDAGDATAAFHHLQMGLAQAQGELASLGGWVWSWWQWRYSDNKRDRLMLYHSTHETLANTSSIQKGHVLLLRMILEVELKLVPTVTPLDLTGALRSWSETYLMRGPTERHEMARSLEARLDIQDLTPLSS
jgi:hypothetical protein